MPALLYVSLFGLFVGWILLRGPPRRPLVLSRMFGVFIGMNLGWFLRMLFLHLGMLSPGLLLMIFGLFKVGMLRRVYFGPILKLEVLLLLAALPFLAEVCYGFVGRRLGDRAAGGKISSKLYWVSHSDEVDVHRAQYFVNSSLSLVLLFRGRLKSVADVLKGIRSKGFTQSRWDALLRYWGAVCRPWSVVVLFPHFIPGIIGFLRISMAFSSGCLIPFKC